jgi:hypothetical protein
MQKIYIVGVAILIAACSTHRVRCRGALQPINKAVAATTPSKSPTPESRP